MGVVLCRFEKYLLGLFSYTSECTAFMKWFLSISAVASLVAAMAFGYLGHTDLLVAGLIASLTLLVVANLDRVSEFKASAGGIEARTREVVNRAEGAIAELRILALHMAEVSLSLAMRQGRWDGYSDEELEKLQSSVLSNLERLGIAEDQRLLVLKEWHRVVEFDYVHYILGSSRIPEGASPKEMQAWKELREGGITRYPSPETLHQFLAESGFLSAARVEYLEDYRYYAKYHHHRRLEMWRVRQEWGHLAKGTNPSIEETAFELRPPSAGHVKR